MSTAVTDPQAWTRADCVKAVISLLLGIAPILFMILEWSVAWWILGRQPESMIDDPKQMGGVVWFLDRLSLFFLLALFLIFPWSSLHWIGRHGGSRTGQLVALGCFLLPLSTLVVLRISNFAPIVWWMGPR
jgi:formate hydrogenlyase subunit 3/multisubunit Na+/H+ antiporter MnhD subunit